MMKSMLVSGVIAGFAAGLLAAVLHFAFVQNLILLGETYETGAAVHFGGVVAEAEHDHDHAEALAKGTEATEPATESTEDGHDHDHAVAGAEETSVLSRDAFTVLFAGVIWVAYGLIMVAGFALAELAGHKITARQGLLWGLCGYLAFQMAPAMGLAPELPGSMAADLVARQTWWWGTAAATAAGLALIGYGKGIPAWGAGAVLIAAPHIIGAPMPDGFGGVAPPELAGAFAARTLGVGLMVWAALGTIAGWQWSSNKSV